MIIATRIYPNKEYVIREYKNVYEAIDYEHVPEAVFFACLRYNRPYIGDGYIVRFNRLKPFKWFRNRVCDALM